MDVLLEANPWMCYLIVGVISVCVGSFLNVVICRLPRMLEEAWRRECALAVDGDSEDQEKTKANQLSLSFPGSHCPHCQKPLRWYHNIPLLSFMFLLGQCAFCKQKISLRYPLVEFLSLAAGLFLYWHFGLTPAFFGVLFASWLLIILISIDFACQLLPDNITYLLLWLGLLFNARSVFANPSDAIFGAVAGYLILWLVGFLYTRLTKREGMGYGDYKLLAALGAWVGWQYVCWIVLLSSLAGGLVAVVLLLLRRANAQTAIAFGPYLALAGWCVLLWGKDIAHIFAYWTQFN